MVTITIFKKGGKRTGNFHSKLEIDGLDIKILAIMRKIIGSCGDKNNQIQYIKKYPGVY